jgi:hypothetical protein
MQSSILRYGFEQGFRIDREENELTIDDAIVNRQS